MTITLKFLHNYLKLLENARDEITKERAHQEIADHLLAFARQFSADTRPG